MEKARDLIKHNKKSYIATDFPNATENTTRPDPKSYSLNSTNIIY